MEHGPGCEDSFIQASVQSTRSVLVNRVPTPPVIGAASVFCRHVACNVTGNSSLRTHKEAASAHAATRFRSLAPANSAEEHATRRQPPFWRLTKSHSNRIDLFGFSKTAVYLWHAPVVNFACQFVFIDKPEH